MLTLPFVWEPNSKIKDGKAYVLDSTAKFDNVQNYYEILGSDGVTKEIALDVLVDSIGHVYVYDSDAVIVQLADGSGHAVYLYDDKATYDASGNIFTNNGPQVPVAAVTFTQEQLEAAGYG